MQRRAAAAYIALFLLLAAGSYAMIATTEAPTPTVENPNHDVGAGEELTVGGRTYEVASLSAEVSSGGGGHGGGGGGIERSATLRWRNESAAYSRTWTNSTTLANYSLTREDGRVVVETPRPSANLTLTNRSVAAGPGRTATDVTVPTPNGSIEVRVIADDVAERLAVRETGPATVVSYGLPGPATVNLTFGEGGPLAPDESRTNLTATVAGVPVNDTATASVTLNFTAVTTGRVAGAEVAGENTVVVDYLPADVRTYSVLFPGESTVLLREVPAENLTRDGQEFVVVDENDDGRDELVPIEEYDALDRVRITPEDDVRLSGNETDVAVGNDSVTFSWTFPTNETVEIGDKANVTLGPEGSSQRFFAFFPDNNTLYLTTDYDSYGQQLATAREFHERQNGFWGITLLSMVGAAILSGLAFLPRKEV